MNTESLAENLSRAKRDLTEPWLVAAWPGMGGVAQLAVTYLVQMLEASPLGSFSLAPYTEVEAIHVRGGVIDRGDEHRCRLFAWKNPAGGPDLVLAHSDLQPTARGFQLGEQLLDAGRALGVPRVLTFAALGVPITPDEDSRVYAVVTRRERLAELRQADVLPLQEGRIGGMNGVLLAAAASRGIDAACLLGTIPYYASTVPNPKASAAVLRSFMQLTGLRIDMGPIDRGAEETERSLMKYLEELRAMAPKAETAGEDGVSEPGQEEVSAADRAVQMRIENLFERAKKDRSIAMQLKSLLDEHELFAKYEDRFLDLFKDAE